MCNQQSILVLIRVFYFSSESKKMAQPLRASGNMFLSRFLPLTIGVAHLLSFFVAWTLQTFIQVVEDEGFKATFMGFFMTWFKSAGSMAGSATPSNRTYLWTTRSGPASTMGAENDCASRDKPSVEVYHRPIMLKQTVEDMSQLSPIFVGDDKLWSLLGFGY